MNLGPASDEAALPASFISELASAAESDYLTMEYIEKSPYTNRAVDAKRNEDDMNREQVLDLLDARRAEDNLRFERLLNEVKEIGNRTQSGIDVLSNEMRSQGKDIKSFETKLATVQADNQRTRATVRTSAISLGFGLASLFVAVIALLLNGVFGSFNLGAKVLDTARVEAERVYSKRDEISSVRQENAIPTPSASPKINSARDNSR